ncbi:MAG: glycosyltransferase family 4 protein [Paracoccaceae bacterium]
MPPPRLIDLTRLTSRAGRGALTGIDRVEAAWADALTARPEPLFALVATRLGFLLLDRAGIAALLGRVAATIPLGPPDLIGRLMRRGNPLRGRCEADLRRIAIGRAPGLLLGRLLRRIGPSFDYFSLGHAIHGRRTLGRIARAGGRIRVMLHDTIPLDHPDLARKGTAATFAGLVGAVAARADTVIYPTEAARRTAEVHLARAGRVPPAVVSALGVALAAPDASALPARLDLARAYVLALGTIEPRKNLALLCDVWHGAAGLPDLFVVGHPGWADAQLFDRLRQTPGIHVLGALPDGAVAALMVRARALVFPSLAEGFGLPPLEAAARGLPVLCSDLPVLREVLKDYPVYLKPADVYAWTKAISAAGRLEGKQSVGSSGLTIADWATHVEVALRALHHEGGIHISGVSPEERR